MTRILMVPIFLLMFFTITEVQGDTITFESGDRYAENGFTLDTGIRDNLYANPFSTPNSGYDTVLTSGDYVAFAQGAGGSIFSIASFTYNGAWYAAAWDDPLEVTLTGLLDSVEKYSETISLSWRTKQWITSDFVGIDELRISSDGNQVTWDVWTYNEETQNNPIPEPATVALLGIGLVGLAGAEVRRRRKKKANDKS